MSLALTSQAQTPQYTTVFGPTKTGSSNGGTGGSWSLNPNSGYLYSATASAGVNSPYGGASSSSIDVSWGWTITVTGLTVSQQPTIAVNSYAATEVANATAIAHPPGPDDSGSTADFGTSASASAGGPPGNGTNSTAYSSSTVQYLTPTWNGSAWVATLVVNGSSSAGANAGSSGPGSASATGSNNIAETPFSINVTVTYP